MIDFRSLVKAGVHFGHQKTRWCPRMAPYIWGIKNNIHLIDVSKTAFLMSKAATFLKSVAAKGQPILWVGTKKAAKDAIVRAGTELNMPYVSHRWIGGTLSNFAQVKKSVTRCLHFEDILAKAEQFPHYTKKEFNTFQKVVDRLSKNVGGIKKLTWPIGAIVVVDVLKEQSAVREAARMGVPIVALVDTNCDPTLIDHVIPTNDDAPRAVNIVMNYLIEAVQEGLKEAASAPKKELKEDAAQDAAEEKADKKASKPAPKKATSVKKVEPAKAAVEEKKTVKKSADAKASKPKATAAKTADAKEGAAKLEAKKK